MVLRVLVTLGSFVLSSMPTLGDEIDCFENTDAWSLIVADGVEGEIVAVDGSLRLDYDFSAGAGYCVVRRLVDLPLDPNYRFGLKLRGTGPRNTLEFKLIDQSGYNVWWVVERGIEFPSEWSSRSMRRRHFSFAWGPSEDQLLTAVGAIEIAVTADQGGKGSIWLDDLVYERLPDPEPEPTEPRAINGDGTDLGRVEPDGSVHWSIEQGGMLELVFEAPVEFSAIELDWADGSVPDVYSVESSVDAGNFKPIARVVDSDGGTDTLFAPETEARIVRLIVPDANTRLDAIRFTPAEDIPDANAYFVHLASRATRGAYPKYFGELAPWTVIGLPDHQDEALVSATGAIEPIKSGYSLEPFIVLGGRVSTWADATLTQSLKDRSLPIPSVHWAIDGLTLDITALATDGGGGTQVLAQYRITNTSIEAQRLTLALAARPFQVLPAVQTLNTIGGVVRADSVEVSRGLVCVDGRVFAIPHTDADAMLVADSSSGSLIDRLGEGSRRSQSTQAVGGQFPSGALLYDLHLTPGESQVVVVSMPMNADAQERASRTDRTVFAAAMQRERSRWEDLLDRAELIVPDSEARLRDTVRANLGYILINADGAGIQPGSRSYERSWIRDGAMTSAALIAMGHADDARAFIEWYSGYQYRDGKIPCVVDARGPDPVDENDAPGEFLFAIRNSAEAGGAFDARFARSMYPKVRATVNYIDSMLSKRQTPEYTQSQDPILRACAGLMPESISHEGYAAKPMHSYWDDFWVYRGLWDAAEIAERLDETEDMVRFEMLAERFGVALGESVRQAASAHGISYIPGCVELGDFDATSSSIAFYPTGAASVLDHSQLESTFERAWESTQRRMNGEPWDGMTPYEVRTIGTFIRLGWIDRSHQYMDWLMERRDPEGWNQWGEIAYREQSPARFVGDMPHTWVGSGAILSILSMFAYEEGDAIVLAAGVPVEWLHTQQLVGVRGMVTRFGTLGYTLKCEDGELVLDIESDFEPPMGYRIDVSRLMQHPDSSIGSEPLIVVVNGIRIPCGAAGVVEVRTVRERTGKTDD